MKQARQIVRHAIILTASSLLMRTVGVWYSVAISNRAGAEVMGLFSLMSGVYGFALTLATSGIHFGVTRAVSETVSRGHPQRIGALMRKALLYASLCGCVASFLLFFGAPIIGMRWLKDIRTIPSLRLFALSLPLVAISSVFGGYFTAVRKSYKSAVLQLVEQGAKIWITMRFLALMVGKTPEQLLCALVLGGVLAETLSFLIEFPLFLRDRRRRFPLDEACRGEGLELVRITLPMALTSYIRSGLITLQHILIPEGLRNSGSSHASALVAYGKIHSMALPVVLYPAAIISSFAGLLIPVVAECCVKKEEKRIRYMVSRVWSLTLFFSIGAAGLLICFSEPLGNQLYPNTNAGYYIRILAPLIPIMYLDTATDAFLKGMGEQLYAMKINIIDALISVLLVALLVPRMGIRGYLISIYLSETFNTVFSILRLLSVSHVRAHLCKWILKPLLSVVAATCLVRFLLRNPPISISLLVCYMVLTAGLYFLFLSLCQAVSSEDRNWLRELIS
ncbi:MAG: hypothetical protein E7620_05810 [Ruminococcaceae bacterium]|nr:hypothetical protein [Oscillospiraceae bacterium]